MKRREFLLLTAGFALSNTLPLQAKKLPNVVIEPNKIIGLSSDQWQLMDAVLNHLFPSEANAPGAKDVYATAWLHNALAMPKTEQSHRDFMRDGLMLLEKLANKTHQKSFIQLSEAQRESTLRTLEQDREGRAWLRETLRYILEALLTDPIYGGNSESIGWKWLKHQPGFPLPVVGKRYYEL
ncbi:MAG: gluconate 2-dehydrogenase subunit 3 family protein [Cocleimonas sp.]|nr:gluconate 2-dehydrogenase subunit 3 family protein [Cocleimonas sp.]